MTDPYIHEVPKGATWDGEKPSSSFREKMQSQLQGRISGELQLPSEEVMRREVETGVFSPESIAVANSILENAESIEDAVDDLDRTEADYYWIDQRQSDAANADRQKSFIEQQTDGIMQRVTAPKPNLKELSKHFVKHAERTSSAMNEVAEAGRKATTAFKEMGEKIGRVKKEYVPQPHLTYRPFRTREMELLRDQLRAAS